MSTPAALAHLRELAERKSKAYELLVSLEQNPSADESCFQSLARVADRVQFHEISLDGAALRSLSGFVGAPSPELGSTLAVLDVASSEAEPDRKCLQLLLTHFAGWISSASEAARPAILEILPNIAPHLKDLGSAGVESLIAGFNRCASQEDRDLLARAIVRYQETSAEIIATSAKIASSLLSAGAGALIERLLIVAPPEEMFESKDARELLPAIAGMDLPGADAPLLSAAAAVCLAVAKHNASSAVNLARQLPAAVAPLPAESRRAYLKAFESIVDEAGISLLSYGLKQMPAFFQKAGPESAREFVMEGVAIARRFGRIAAQQFFEQKTAASKQAASQITARQ